MTDPTPPKSDRIGGDYKQGSNPGPGGEIDPGDVVPPYEGRTTGPEDDVRGASESVSRSLPDEVVGGADQTASPARESPAREDELTDEDPEPALGVGESLSTRAEDIGESSSGPGRAGGTGTSDERTFTDPSS